MMMVIETVQSADANGYLSMEVSGPGSNRTVCPILRGGRSISVVSKSLGIILTRKVDCGVVTMKLL